MKFEIAAEAGEISAPPPGAVPGERDLSQALDLAVQALAGDGIEVIYRGEKPRLREAARLCAHAIRLYAHALNVQAIQDGTEPPDWLYGTFTIGATTGAVPMVDRAVTAAIDSESADELFATGAGLLRGLKDTTDPEAQGARLTARWLMACADTREQSTAAAEELAGWVVGPGAAARPHIGTAWWYLHGPHVIDRLRADPQHSAARGRPPATTRAHREALATAIRATYAAGDRTKTWLAAHAGITRRTLDAWLTGEQREE